MKRLAIISIALVLAACSGNTKVESDLGISGAPDWVNEGTQAVDNKDGQLINGVGMAPAMGDSSLQKSTADNRARAEVSRVLQTYIDSTLDDYTTSANDGETSSSSASVERQIRSTTKLALSGARIIGHWRDKKTGDIYSFASLDMDKLEDLVAKADNLHAGFKDFYEQSSEQSFQRFIDSQ